VGHAKAGSKLPAQKASDKKKLTENRTVQLTASEQDDSRSALERNAGLAKGQHVFTNPVRLPTQNPIPTGSHANDANLIALPWHGSQLKWQRPVRR
jgi:hypothetical protein